MKKLFTLLLVIALLLPAAAGAVDDWMVAGNWMGYWHEENGARSIICIVLEDDYTAYYVTQFFHESEPGLGRAYIGEWSRDGDIVHVKTGNNTSTDLQFKGGIMIDTLTQRMFFLAEWK